VIAREHRAQRAPRIPREGVVFREPPDMAGGPVLRAQKARRLGRNHSASDDAIMSQNEKGGNGLGSLGFLGFFSFFLTRL
jgi:hypothetical protein